MSSGRPGGPHRMATTTSPAETATSSVMTLVGTTKGLFTLRSSDGRESFELAGPTFAGEEVYSTCIDTRSGSTRLYTGSVSNHWGPVLRRLRRSRRDMDRGREPRCGSRSPPTPHWRGFGNSPAPADEPDVMYAASNRRPCSAATTAGAASRSSRVCGTTRIARSGNPAAAGCACTRSSSTPTTPTAC